jgi:CRP-like cAMP-binding protein/Fe-S-cluster-containing hydrogenase component 2
MAADSTPLRSSALAEGLRALSLERMREYPFFADRSDGILKRLQPNVFEVEYAAGQAILRMGDYTDAVHFIAEGVVQLRFSPPADVGKGRRTTSTSGDDDTGWKGRLRSLVARVRGAHSPAPAEPAPPIDGTVIMSDMPVDLRPSEDVLLEAGEIFGETSALSRYAVSTDVIAVRDVRCLIIRAPALRTMLKQREFADFKRTLDDRYRERTLASHLRRVDLLADLGDEALDELRRTAQLLSFEPGNVIVEEGSTADAFYLVRGGYVKVAVRSGAGEIAVTYLRKGDYAGEAALLLDEPWPYSLSALEHVELVRIDRPTFERVIAQRPAAQTRLWETVVERLKRRGQSARNPLSSQVVQMAMDTGLIHGESVLLIDLTTCTRCDDCVKACADTHGGTPRFIREGIRLHDFTVATACYQCTDPVCMIGCPTGAITRPIGTLEVTINRDTCIGCENCVRRCPWGNITTVPYESPALQKQINLATKCDLCMGRTDGPACVQMCPHGSAIRVNFKDLDKVSALLSR